MMHRTITPSLRKPALSAGSALIAMALIAAFSYGFVLQNLTTTTDPLLLGSHIRNAPLLFRLGIFGFLIILIADIIAAWALYIFFQPVSKNLSLLAAWLRLLYTAFLAIAISDLIQMLTVAEMNVTAGATPLASFYLSAFNKTWSAGLLIFGLHLFLLGRLALQAGNVPKIIGILLQIAAICYITDSLAEMLLPDYEVHQATIEAVTTIPMIVGELGLALWLVLKGGKTKQRLLQPNEA